MLVRFEAYCNEKVGFITAYCSDYVFLKRAPSSKYKARS